MLRKWMISLTCVCLFVTPAARGAETTMKQAVATLPDDAIGFACVPNLKALDTNLQRTISDLGLQGIIPPPMSSLVGIMRMYMPFLQGMNEEGTLAIVLMPADTLQQLGQSACIFIPTNDPKAMIEQMGGQPGEGGIWNVNLFGQPQFATVAENRLIIAQSADYAKRAAQSKGRLDKKIKPNVLASLEGLDKAVWLDAERILTLAGPQIQQMLGVMAMMQASQGPMGAQQGEALKKQVDMFTKGASSLAFGLALMKSGLDLRVAFDAKPGTELHEQMTIKPTAESLLRGLPEGKYILAFGQRLIASQMKSSVEYLEPYIEKLSSVEGVDAERVGQVKKLVNEWLPMCSEARATISTVPAGSDGVFGLSAIFQASDAKRWVEMSGEAVNLVKAIINEAKGENVPDDLKGIASALAFESDAEEVAGIKLAHLKFDVSKLPDADEESIEQFHAIVGKDGLLFRMGAVDAGKAVVTFGGGKTFAGRLIESARSDAAPLEDDAGIKKVSANLPRERASVVYIAVDQVVETIKRVQSALDEEELPIRMPELNAPLTMSATGGDGWSRQDLFLPKELMIAVKNAVMTMMGGGQMPPSPPGAPTPPGGN